MPIVVTFDLENPRPRELNRIRGAFERLGWEHLGNTAYRYPRLQDSQAEDWFNHVIPALMLLRALTHAMTADNRGMVRFTIDAQSSTGYSENGPVGTLPLPSHQIDFVRPSPAGRDFGMRRLQDWLDGVVWPYADVLDDTAPTTPTSE